jgi:hypothetical protein
MLDHGKRLICDDEGGIFFAICRCRVCNLDENKKEFSADYNFIVVPEIGGSLTLSSNHNKKVLGRNLHRYRHI